MQACVALEEGHVPEWISRISGRGLRSSREEAAEAEEDKADAKKEKAAEKEYLSKAAGGK